MIPRMTTKRAKKKRITTASDRRPRHRLGKPPHQILGVPFPSKSVPLLQAAMLRAATCGPPCLVARSLHHPARCRWSVMTLATTSQLRLYLGVPRFRATRAVVPGRQFQWT